MRIFFVTNNYIPYSGGVVQSITTLVKELQNQGYEVFVITLSFLETHADPDYVIRIPCPIKFKYKNNYMAIPWRPGYTLDRLIAQYKPAIIHVHHPFLLGACAVKSAQKYNIACVFTHHTLYTEYTHYIPLIAKWSKSFIAWYVKRFCNKVDAIIAPSTYVKAYLQAQQIRTPITVIASPLRNCFITDLNKKTKEDNNFFELLLVTRFVSEKNIPFVFEVMRLLPSNFRLTLVGYGYEYEKLRKLAFDELRLSQNRVQFIHKPNTKTLLTYYRQADLFIFPSQTDTQGIVLAESMSQAVPVIALDGPGQRDIIINGINGFIVHNAPEMATTINRLSNDFSHLQQLSFEAYKTAQKYKAEHLSTRIIKVYNAIIRKKSL